MHEIFAACRVWQLHHIQRLPKHASAVAARIFTAERWAECASKIKDQRDNLIETCFNILHSTGFEDDPSDRTRTVANMEQATIIYCDERFASMEHWPIWVEDKKAPGKRIGIEQPFDVELVYSDGRIIRYIGTIDGLVFNSLRERYEIDENKTAARLDDSWRNSFDMAHQVTGYCACSTTVFGFPVLHCRVTGLKIRPSQSGESILPVEALARDAHAILHWGHWVRYTVDLFERYRADFEHAPRFTHSCNRYFRPCSLLPFCCDTPDGRKDQFAQMVEAEMSPSERAVLEG